MPTTQPSATITATPFRWINPKQLPPIGMKFDPKDSFDDAISDEVVERIFDSWSVGEEMRDAEEVAVAQARALDHARSARRPMPINDNKPTLATQPSGYPGIASSATFVGGFVPPDYHVDGIAQAGYLYSMTAMTGAGKTAVLLLVTALTALGDPLGDREVRKGRVLYFAGENPDDVRARWIAIAHHMDFDPTDIDVHFIAGTFGVDKMFERIRSDVLALGGADMIVIDTSAAYFQGQDENSNVEAGRHARSLRTLTTLPGKPVVFVACHPVKNPDPSNLLPRGGGAFIAEVDGNLVLSKSADGSVRMHWHGKHRGPNFEPVVFELKEVTAPALVDSKGRGVPTVMAEVLSDRQTFARADSARADEDVMLVQIERDGKNSYKELAERLGWASKKGEPDKERARRVCGRLKGKKLIVEVTRGVGWKLTKVGETTAVEVRQEMHERQALASAAARLTGS